MMTLVLDRVAPEQTLVLLKLENVRDLHQALRALAFRENCVVDISKNGLRIVVDDQNCVQGIAYFKSDLFTEFILNEDVVTFRIPLPIFTGCLSAFGAGVSAVMKMTYNGFGEPLKVMVEKDGIVARSLIKTQNPDIILDFDFNPATVAAKVIMKPRMLKETFHELDQSSRSVSFKVDRFSLSVTTEGDLGKIKTKFPHYSEQIERFECKQDIEFTYRLSLVKRMTPSLNICSKLSLRIDHRGILSVQFMVKHNEDNRIFLEFFCVPDIPTSEEENIFMD
ncbi:Repair protein Rad1/Rec1/Rad17 family protein [Acanthocheilonema viteae]